MGKYRNGQVVTRTKIESMEEREEIEKLLIGRVPYRDISKQYGVSVPTLSKHYKEKLMPRIAKAMFREDEDNAKRIIEKMEEHQIKLDKLLNAVDTWLQDPENEGEYTLDPMAKEIEVVYQVEDEEGRKYNKKDTLQWLLDRYIRKDEEVLRVSLKQKDPRTLMLDIMRESREQLKLIAQITGDLKSVTTEINVNVVGQNIAGVLLDAAEGNTKVQKALSLGLRDVIRDAKESL